MVGAAWVPEHFAGDLDQVNVFWAGWRVGGVCMEILMRVVGDQVLGGGGVQFSINAFDRCPPAVIDYTGGSFFL